MVLGTPFQRVLNPQVFTRNIHHPRMPQRQNLLSTALSDEGRAASVPLSTMHTSSTTRSASIPRGSGKLSPSASDTHLPREPKDATSLDLIDLLERSEQSVVKTRSGSVLSRGLILKTDHYPSGLSIPMNSLVRWFNCVLGRALDLDLNVHGAPNFRASRHGDLNIFGAAQPRTQGLRAILSVLRCRPITTNPSHVIWFSTREEPIGTSLVTEVLKDIKMSLDTLHICELITLLSLHIWPSICPT